MSKYLLLSIALIFNVTFLQVTYAKEDQASAPKVKKYRVAVMNFMQETCSFCPGGDAKIEDWLKLGPLLKGDALLQSNSFIKGFMHQSNEYGDMEVIGLTSPISLFGGSSRSWSTEKSFNYFVDQMIKELKAAMPVDGVYLSLHGALAVRNIPRPEAEIAKRFREVVGPNVPITATFDLHGNEDAEFLKYADFSFVTKRYPHYDTRLQGERAARALHLSMAGKYKSTTATRKPNIITPTLVQWTGAAPSSSIMERARRWEARIPGVFVSVFYGFPWSDVPDAGAAIQVMTNDDQQLADKIADDMKDYMWRVRKKFASVTLPKPNEAAKMVKTAITKGQTPIAIGDYSDRPGDAMHITRAFDAAGINKVIYGAISSPKTLEKLKKLNAKIGDDFNEKIGGFTVSGGEPYPIKGTIAYVGKWYGYDYVVAVSFGKGNLVIIVPAYTQIRTPNYFKFGTIKPEDYDVFVVKSRVHFRRGFDETGYAKTIIIVDAPSSFIGTIDLSPLPYKHLDLNKLYPYGLK